MDITVAEQGVKVNAVTFTRERKRWSMLESIAAVHRLIVAQERRARDGEGGLAELAALAALERVLGDTIGAVAIHLLEHDEASYKEIGIALDLTKQGALKRYPGASSRPVGGRPARLR
jgi:hypothetical protein